MSQPSQLARPIRVFISYAHDDETKAACVASHLERLGAKPMYDVDIRGGTPFREEIRWRISYAHIFVCILTARSQISSWVVSELGYAMGLGVPVLPLCFDELPPGLAQEIQAVRVRADLSDLGEVLTPSVIDDLVAHSRTVTHAGFEVTDHARARTQFLVEEIRRVHRYARHDLHIRQRAAFSSFSIPDASPRHPDWDAHDGGRQSSAEERGLLREERRLLEEHARHAGCGLIIDPYVIAFATSTSEQAGDRKIALSATLTRLKTLKAFLERMSDDTCVVAVERGAIEGNLTILGDWLSAEAVVPHYQGGYRQTTFARHGPTVLNRIDQFDRELADALADNGVSASASRQNAIRVLSDRLATLDQDGC